MRQELAALRLGYLGQELHARQRTVWEAKPLEVRPVQNCLQEIERTLHLLGSRLNCYQGATFSGMRDRIVARHDGASGHLVEMWMETQRLSPNRLSSDSAFQAWKFWQEEDWEEIQALLEGIAEGQLRPWYVIGDHLGDVVFQLREQTLTAPITVDRWDYLYAGVDLLPDPVRCRVENTFPLGYRSASHLCLQLVDTFHRLCDFLAEEGRQIPFWDGESLWFQMLLIKRFKKPAQNQRRALDDFQRQGWPNSILNPFRLGHTNKVRAIETCKRTAEDLNNDHSAPNVIRFGHALSGDRLTWRRETT